MKKSSKGYGGRALVTFCGIFLIILTITIGVFLIIRGMGTFTEYHHSILEFLFSSKWDPKDVPGEGGGQVGAAIYIVGSLLTCGLAMLIAVPFSIAAAIFITEISPNLGTRLFQPAIEIFVGIPSVVYGWLGATILVPFIRDVFHAPVGGYSVLAGSIVLAIMIFPTITTVSADAIRSVPDSYRQASYGLGSTRWQMIWHVVLPAGLPSILTGVILGLTRAIGEALAVAMVIGRKREFPKNILYPTHNMTAVIASDMGNTANNGEYNMALWSIGLFIISIVCILLIHLIAAKNKKKNAAH